MEELKENKPKNIMKNKPVSFNLADKDQKEMYDFCCKKTTNFSGYVKRLIQRDMDQEKEKNKNTNSENVNNVNPVGFL